MAKVYAIAFRVRGTFRFPFDMLRYDQCWPTDSQSTAAMDRANDDPRQPLEISLVHYDRDRNWHPTYLRWESFLWKVVEGSVARGVEL